MPHPTWQGPTRLPGTGPLPRRLATAVVDALASGALHPGDALLPSRRLAGQLGIGRGAVVAAYDELTAAGYLEARPGSGTFVVEGAAEAARRSAGPPPPVGRSLAGPVEDTGLGAPTPPPDALDLRPGHAEPALISTRDWRAAWRHGIPDPPGAEALSRVQHPELQEALAGHLRRMRGVTATPDEVVVVPGASAAFTLLAVAAGLAGADVAVEDPGYRRARAAFVGAGAGVRPVPVDEDGLDPGLLRPTDAAVYLTPAHQYPLGARMPVARRGELVDLAHRQGTLVVEDDYDGEFRYGVAPMPALRSVPGGAGCVAYVGTASKVLTPDLGLAWVVPPPHLLAAVRRAQDQLSLGASPVAARALAHLVGSGALGRQLGRAARLYRARRDALVAALRRRCPDLRVAGVEAGLHLVVLLDDGDGNTDGGTDTAVVDRLRSAGIWVEALSGYFLGRSRPGLVIGYSRLPESRAPLVAEALAQAVLRPAEALADRADSAGRRE
ncbi:PLP-dependent aminotransferase family protein [Ornithinimicrobium sp. LYQ92]|uniref:MocR-like pyridoxine biosynthesis transcription factor PdxR n=1 Tax=Serinicoccus sp. LYQ92 TaxID=3378798 RepID=UPI00385433A2